MGGSIGQQPPKGAYDTHVDPMCKQAARLRDPCQDMPSGIPHQSHPFGQVPTPTNSAQNAWLWANDLTAMLPQAVKTLYAEGLAGLEARLKSAFQGLSPEQEVSVEHKLLAALERQKQSAVAREDYIQASHYKVEIDALLGNANVPRCSKAMSFARAASFMATTAAGKGKGKGKSKDKGKGFGGDCFDDFTKGEGKGKSKGKGFDVDCFEAKGKGKGFDIDCFEAKGNGKGFDRFDDCFDAKGMGKGFDDCFDAKGMGKGFDDCFDAKGKGKGFDDYFDAKGKGNGKGHGKGYCGDGFDIAADGGIVNASFARRERAMIEATEKAFSGSFATDAAQGGSFASRPHGSYFAPRTGFQNEAQYPDQSFAVGSCAANKGARLPQCVSMTLSTPQPTQGSTTQLISTSSFGSPGHTTQPPHPGQTTQRPSMSSFHTYVPSSGSFAASPNMGRRGSDPGCHVPNMPPPHERRRGSDPGLQVIMEF